MKKIVSGLTKGSWSALLITAIFALGFVLTACPAGDEWLTKGQGGEGVQVSETGGGPEAQPAAGVDTQPDTTDLTVQGDGGAGAKKSFSRTKKKFADKTLSEEFDKAEKELKAAEESVEKKEKILQELEKGQAAANAEAAKKIEKLEISFWIGDDDGDATTLPLYVQFCKAVKQCTYKIDLPSTSFSDPPTLPGGIDVYMRQGTGYYAAGDQLDIVLIEGPESYSDITGITKDDLEITKLCISQGTDAVGINNVVVKVNGKPWCNYPYPFTLNNGGCKDMTGTGTGESDNIEPEPPQGIVDGQKDVETAAKAADDIAGIDPLTEELYPKSVLAKLNDKIKDKKQSFESTNDKCYDKQVKELENREFGVTLAYVKATTAALKAEAYLLDMKIEYLTAKKNGKAFDSEVMEDGEKNIDINKNEAIDQKDTATELLNKKLVDECSAEEKAAADQPAAP